MTSQSLWSCAGEGKWPMCQAQFISHSVAMQELLKDVKQIPILELEGTAEVVTLILHKRRQLHPNP